MKQFFLVLGVSMIACGAVNAQGKPKTTAKPKTAIAKPKVAVLKTSIDSFSYAVGMNVANNLKSQGIENFSTAAMQKAIQDVFNKRKFLLDDQQANMCIQQTLQVNMSKKNQVVRAQGEAFLAANKKRPGVITLPSGVQYEVLKKGDSSSASPRIQDTVVAHYRGTLVDGTPFDASYDRGEPLTRQVNGVITGWTEVLLLMHIGDKWKVYIPSELGYGERGAGASIPGGSALIFEMELLGIKPGPATEPQK